MLRMLLARVKAQTRFAPLSSFPSCVCSRALSNIRNIGPTAGAVREGTPPAHRPTSRQRHRGRPVLASARYHGPCRRWDSFYSGTAQTAETPESAA